jgi:glycosyltransferase involved in cell wall biosynthesis
VNVECHIVSFNEELILPYSIRHYKEFCQRIVLHDNFSTDRTCEIARAEGLEVKTWGKPDQMDDLELTNLKNTCWRGTDADWVVVPDADEFVYFPDGPVVLQTYVDNQVAVVKPHGFEMFDYLRPSKDGQIYDEITTGSPEDKWMAKPILFSPNLVASISFNAGAHACTAILRDGRKLANPTTPTDPPTYLLHYKHLGKLEDIGARYDLHKSRMSAQNRRMNWGWWGDGKSHSEEKRKMILQNLIEVIK